jgi:hypothetical protein
VAKHWRILRLVARFRPIRSRIKADPHARDYRDAAMTPVVEGEEGDRELLTHSAAARAAVAHERRVRAIASGAAGA